jgi:sRNA-binding protein
MRGPDPARTLALSLVELLEPALAEAEAESAARAAEARAAEARAAEAAREAQEADEGEDAAAEGETASPEPEASARGLRTWGLAAELSLRVPMGSQPHMGGVRVRGLRALTDRVRVEFGGQLERGRRRVSLGRVVVTALALDLSVLLSVLNGAAVGLAVGAGARLGGLFWRGQPNADDVTETRLRSAHLELFARAAADWYVARRWALRLDLELGGVLVGSRAVVVDNAASNGVAVSGFRAALALGVVHAF